MSFTVTATTAQSGVSLKVVVLTGAKDKSLQPGATAKTTSGGGTLRITPQASGSLVYAVSEHCTSTALPNASTVFLDPGVSPFKTGTDFGIQEFNWNGRSATTTTSGAQITLGESIGDGDSSMFSLAEILAAAGKTLAEDASTPAVAFNNTTTVQTITTASFSPPPSALLVAMATNFDTSGATTPAVTLSDTSGLGLTWTQVVSEPQANFGYSGIWLAQMPGPSFSGSATAGITITASCVGQKVIPQVIDTGELSGILTQPAYAGKLTQPSYGGKLTQPQYSGTLTT